MNDRTRVPSSRRGAARSRIAMSALALALAVTATTGFAPAGAGDPVGEARSGVSAASDRLAGARSSLAGATDDVALAQQRAIEAARQLGEAQSRHAELTSEIAGLEERRIATIAEIEFLRPLVEARAVAAYMGSDQSALDVFAAADIIDAARRAALLASAKKHEDALISDLGLLEDRLGDQQFSLAADRAELADVLDELTSAQERIADELSGAEDALSAARSNVEASEAALSAANAALEEAQAEARRLEEERRIAATTTTTTTTAPSDSSDDAPTPSDRPASQNPDDPQSSSEEPDSSSGGSSGSMICPIDGVVAFADTWGAPREGGRSHEGVDIFSGPNAPNVAVVDGVVTHGVGERQGNGVFLFGDDGNSYWYFHLASFEGGARRVSQGEVIGYTGDTGNAAPGSYHTHFEYHPDHGAAANPYSITAAACF